VTTRRIPLLAGLAALTLTAAACGDDDPAPVEAPPTTASMPEDSMVDEEMPEDSMVDEEMTEDSMVDEMTTEDSVVDEMMTGDSMVDEMTTGTTTP
jgi:hypothetical protein